MGHDYALCVCRDPLHVHALGCFRGGGGVAKSSVLVDLTRLTDLLAHAWLGRMRLRYVPDEGRSAGCVCSGRIGLCLFLVEADRNTAASETSPSPPRPSEMLCATPCTPSCCTLIRMVPARSSTDTCDRFLPGRRSGESTGAWPVVWREDMEMYGMTAS